MCGIDGIFDPAEQLSHKAALANFMNDRMIYLVGLASKMAPQRHRRAW